MILNTHIWQQTVESAKVAATNFPAWLRAIERARIELERSRYWSFADGVLTIQSTTSHKVYRVADGHTCEAKNGICKHRAARRLMRRYTERLATANVTLADWKTERAHLIADIKTTWTLKYPGYALADELMRRFRCNKLEFLNIDFLVRFQHTLAQ